METDFRSRISAHVASLPASSSTLQKLYTSPYVLLIQALKQGYAKISEIEADIIPAKIFSSMETSAGRMIEAVALPVYGWECVASQMHTANSALDGLRLGDGVVEVATLKSGPRCLNDEMAENFADAILENVQSWAADAGVDRVEFTYGVLYGTQKQSNKKDWHILRNLDTKVPARGGTVVEAPTHRWDCSFELDGVTAEVSIRIGGDWWSHLGGDDCALELWTALIRACVQAGMEDPGGHPYEISDLGEITSLDPVPQDFNVALLQRSQLPWLFFVARHFCDRLVD
ncbi:MAG TPA: PmeII family type II restriction endonuclease [Solirubrobacterales bacterium]|nr:PmeII family type II restriction endonuclease [Solirubrobacterales bacterium]